MCSLSLSNAQILTVKRTDNVSHCRGCHTLPIAPPLLPANLLVFRCLGWHSCKRHSRNAYDQIALEVSHNLELAHCVKWKLLAMEDDIYSDVDSAGFVQDMREYGVGQALSFEVRTAELSQA